MMPTAGLSFSPLDPNAKAQAPANPVQEAIKLLSFRMPTVVGASAPAPGALLGGGPGDAGVAEWLRRMIGGMNQGQPGAPGTTQGPPFGAVPPPHVGVDYSPLPTPGGPPPYRVQPIQPAPIQSPGAGGPWREAGPVFNPGSGGLMHPF